MEVILLEKIEKLGQMGDVVKVKPGFARNFLLPRQKALRATEENRKVFEAQRAQLEVANQKRREVAEGVAAKMDGETVNLIRQAGEAGQLYGSVNARDIADALKADGFEVGRNQVELTKPIKTLGFFPVRVVLHPEVVQEVKVNVARSEEEAKIQAETGRAVISEAAAEQAAAEAPEIAEQVAEAAEEAYEEAAETGESPTEALEAAQEAAEETYEEASHELAEAGEEADKTA